MHEAAYEPVEVVIGGQSRKMRLTLRGVRMLRDALGAGGMQALQEFGAESDDPFAMVDKIGVIVWALLGDSSLSVEDVEGMIDFRELDRITDAIGRVFDTDTEPQPAGKVKAARRPST
jgi:hypothetical protein